MASLSYHNNFPVKFGSNFNDTDSCINDDTQFYQLVNQTDETCFQVDVNIGNEIALSSTSGFQTATNWTIDGYTATHSAGSTTAISFDDALLRRNRLHRVKWSISSATAGSVKFRTPAFATYGSQSSNATYYNYVFSQDFAPVSAGSTVLDSFSFAPTTDFNGTIEVLEILEM